MFRTPLLGNRLRGSTSTASAVEACCRYVSLSTLVMCASRTSASPLLRPLGLGGGLGDESRDGTLCRRPTARAPIRSRMSTGPSGPPYTGGPNIAIIFARSRATSASLISPVIDGLNRCGFRALSEGRLLAISFSTVTTGVLLMIPT